MRKKIVVGFIAVLVLALAGGVAFAHYTGFGGYGGHMVGPGFGEHIMGHGYYGHMWGQGYGDPIISPGYEEYCVGHWSADPQQRSITEKEAELIIRDYIYGNPNLRVGEIKDKGTYFEGEIVTKDNSPVTRLSIDKDTGWIQPLF